MQVLASSVSEDISASFLLFSAVSPVVEFLASTRISTSFMKLHVCIENTIDETFEAATPEEALRRVKAEAAKRAPFLLRGVINAMSDLSFAAEAVKRENAHSGRHDAAPKSAQQFLDWATERGYVTHEA